MKNILTFTLIIAAMMTACGGESAKINEDPTKGITVTKNASCDVTADDCLQFALDYPVAGLNFDCSGDKLNHFATKLDGNVVTGACKLGDEVSFYIQGESNARKVSLGTVKLDNISKIKLATPPRIRLIDIATALTGKPAASLNQGDETVRATMALVKILQGIGLESGDNVIGDIQPTELTIEKKDKLAEIDRRTWARAIEHSFLKNPEICPKCSTAMRKETVFSFFADKEMRKLLETHEIEEGYFLPREPACEPP